VTFGKITTSLSDPLAWLGGIFIGVVTYLVQPGAAFYALWVVVACDLVSRILTESVNHGGLFRAIKDGHIRSDKAMQGTFIKILAYFIMCVIAAQATRIIPYETASGLVSNIIYSVLFFVELLSIAENFIEAGIEQFKWLERFSKKKLKGICDDGSEDGGL
jgi:hypothetical protein